MSRATDISLIDQSLNHTPDNFLDSDDTYTLLCTPCSLESRWRRKELQMISIAGQLARPEDPGGEHGEGLLDGADQDGSQTRIKAGPRLNEDVHHVRRDHVDPRPLGDHHQGPDPLERSDL